MSEKIYLDWSDPRPYWSGGPPETDFIWSEVYVLSEVSSAIEQAGFIPDEEPWDWLSKKVDKKVADQFKKLVIRVNGLEKEKPENLKVTAYHIKKTLSHFGINVNIQSDPSNKNHDVAEVRLLDINQPNNGISVNVSSVSSSRSSLD